MPLSRASQGCANAVGRPSTSSVPAVGGKFPATILTSVDLPAPLSPMRPTTSPAETVRQTSSRAWIAPKCLEMARHSRIGMVHPPRRCARSPDDIGRVQRLDRRSGPSLHCAPANGVGSVRDIPHNRSEAMKTLVGLAVATMLAIAAHPALGQDKTLAIVVKGLDNPFFEQINLGCQKWNAENKGK